MSKVFAKYLKGVMDDRSSLHDAPPKLFEMTKRQNEVMEYYKNNKFKTLLLDGSMGSGKTKILTSIFCTQVYKDRGKNYQYIIGGSTLPTIRRNFLNDMEVIIGRDIKLNKENSFKLYGNTVYCFAGKDADAWKTVRGMNSAGTMLGEMTTLNRQFVKECEGRTRVSDEIILADTNPDSVRHWVKKEYIDKHNSLLDDGETVAVANFNFKIDDNTFISENYKSYLKQSYPSGSALFRRNIQGEWVDETEASIYGDYMKEINYHDGVYLINNLYVGIDLGIRDSTVLIFATKEFNKMKILHWYRNSGMPTGHYIEKIQEFCKTIRFRAENVQIVLPHDSVQRLDNMSVVATRFGEYSKFFPMTAKLMPIPVIDMISSTRKHLWENRVYFGRNQQDLISDIKSYSWKIINGVIDTSQPEHGRESDSPSNTADAFEYLCFYMLGFETQQGAIQTYSVNNNRSYS